MNEKKTNVLLIGDNCHDAKLIKEILLESNSANFYVTHVEKLSKGLIALEKNNFDVVILDLALPDCIGLETFRKVRSKLPWVPIIVLTGSTKSRTDVKKCIDGAQSYLLKGYIDKISLPMRIFEAIEEQRALRAINLHFVKT